MPTFRHIRYAWATRHGEPKLATLDQPPINDARIVRCPQNKFRLDFVMGSGDTIAEDEDCHFLTIHTPSCEGSRPVLVWIHGGAYVAGCGEELAYDGSGLAEMGDIVVVSMSYRLGVFGYLYNPQGAPQNLGLKDQMTALEWIHRYIANFGGDPHRVTLAGQSAGGHSVASLIACCDKPFFRKAIIQSAPLGFGYKTAYFGKQYQAFLNILGKSVTDATVDEMLLAQRRLVERSGRAMSFSPYVPDLGKVMATPSLEKVLLTWQRDDASPFVAMRLNHVGHFGGLVDRIATRIATALAFVLTNKKYASFLRQNNIDVSLCELSWRPQNSKFGACHCLELALLFGSYERWRGVGMLGDIDEAEWKERSLVLRQQWLAFIKQ